MDKVIDLRSDTLTLPSDEMRRSVLSANIGDDCYGEDQTVHTLEKYCSNLFEKEKALFLPSGTMSNQIAIKSHTTPGDEVITDFCYHINYFESAQSSFFSGINFNLCRSKDGILTSEHLREAINSKARGATYANPTLLTTENPVSHFAGITHPFYEMKKLYSTAKEFEMSVHLDGARILNACAATGIPPRAYGSVCDSLNLCLSKGVGAPLGSILLGESAFIDRARKYRKWMGGGLHQSGFIAAPCLYALNNNCLEKLQLDNSNRARTGKQLQSLLPPESIVSGDTNMIMINTNYLNLTSSEAADQLLVYGIKVFSWNKNTIRLVFHNGISKYDVDVIVDRFKQCFSLKTKRILVS